MKTIKNKSKGVEVKILQAFLDVVVDGQFGPKTAAALNAWKAKLGMIQDGQMNENDWRILANMLYTIRYNDKNKYVKMWQLFLGLDADGIFGAKTKSATMAYQAASSLDADGIVGKKTWVKALTTDSPETAKEKAKEVKNLQPVDYKQYDKRWANIVYTMHNTYNLNQTIKSSACGPASMADIVATWWDTKATPATLAKLAVDNDFRTKNSGTAWDFFRYCANKYGASKYIQTSSYATAESAIREGAYVVCSMKPGLFTNGGHYICWWWTDGVYNYTNDPASNSSKRAKQEVKYIRNECKQYFIFYK